MPGRNPREALDAYMRPISESLSCIIDTSTHGLVCSTFNVRGAHPDARQISLQSPTGVVHLVDTQLTLYFQQSFHIVQPEAGRATYYKVKTDSYIYRVDRLLSRDEREEVVSYHWHPHVADDVDFPHLHIHATDHPQVDRIHFPTGRMSVERLVQFLIRDYDVRPRRQDWREIIKQNLEIFEKYRTWQ